MCRSIVATLVTMEHKALRLPFVVCRNESTFCQPGAVINRFYIRGFFDCTYIDNSVSIFLQFTNIKGCRSRFFRSCDSPVKFLLFSYFQRYRFAFFQEETVIG